MSHVATNIDNTSVNMAYRADMVPALRAASGILSADDCAGLPLTGKGRHPNGKLKCSFSYLFTRLPAFLDSNEVTPIFYPHGEPCKHNGESHEIQAHVTSATRQPGSDTGECSIRTPHKDVRRCPPERPPVQETVLGTGARYWC